MKSENGVTLITLVVYCIIMLMIIGIISVIRLNTETNMEAIQSLRGYSTEINKLSMYMVEETKNSSNAVKKISGDGNSIEFTSGNIYVFSNDNIYKVSSDNKKIKICEDIQDCTFSYELENNKEIVKVALELITNVGTKVKTMEYIFTA